MSCRLFLLLALAAWAGPLRAGQDWLGLRTPALLPAPGLDLGVELSQSTRESWGRGNGVARMVDSVGAAHLQRRIVLEAQLGWQLSRAWALELALPTVLAERSPVPVAGSAAPTYRLSDPQLKRQEGLGDVRVALRRALSDYDSGFNAGWRLELTAPSGQGPFESPDPLVATGEGRWQLKPSITAGFLMGSLHAWIQGQGLWQFGREALLSSEAALSFDQNGAQNAPGGPQYLGPRLGAEGVVGLAWAWFKSEGTEHRLGVECVTRGLSAFNSGGSDVNNTTVSSLGLMPQLQARIGSFSAVAAWAAPYIVADNIPLADGGEFKLRASYGF